MNRAQRRHPNKGIDLPEKVTERLSAIDQSAQRAAQEVTAPFTSQKYQYLRGFLEGIGIDVDGEYDYHLSLDNRKVIAVKRPKPPKPPKDQSKNEDKIVELSRRKAKRAKAG